jgi:hypothetical protein
MYIIVVTIFGTMGYGWGLLGILVSLNPLKPKEKTKNNIPTNNSKSIK